jgi:hypothetical protein
MDNCDVSFGPGFVIFRPSNACLFISLKGSARNESTTEWLYKELIALDILILSQTNGSMPVINEQEPQLYATPGLSVTWADNSRAMSSKGAMDACNNIVDDPSALAKNIDDMKIA